ncbi:sodium-coupled neutral amino acid transporter 7-like [Ptychodera flava]|uniref:sodium-coupled neutral amino acid transporter 7-like n=1 Tax=Ptychodera flava TaxID=63121 RepID=UPI00396A90A0
MSVQQASLNDPVVSVFGEPSEESPLLKDNQILLSSGSIDPSYRGPKLISSGTYEESYRTGKNSVFGAALIMIKACIGAGMLAFPAVYGAAGGIVVCIILQVVFVICAAISLMVLAYSSDIHQTVTYETAVASLCGNKVKIACLVVIMGYGLGGCITYLVVLGDQFDKVMELIFETDYFCQHWFLQRRFTVSVSSILFILPLCFPAKIEVLKYSSFFGALANSYIAVIVIVQYYITDTSNRGPITTQPASWMDIFVAFPVIFFAFQCHMSSVPVYCTLKKRTLREYSKVVGLAFTVIFTIYTVTGIYGYLTFGNSVQGDILMSYGSDDIKVTVARIMLVISLLATYPILHYCARAALQGLFKDCGGMMSYIVVYREKYFRITITLLWFTTTLLAALFIPNIMMIISVVGAFAAAFILFFPGLCLLQCGLQNTTTSRYVNRFFLCLGVVFTVLGAFVFGESITMAIMKDIQGTYPGAGATSPCQ